MDSGSITLLSALWNEAPERAALVAHGGPAVTYGSLREQVERLATFLQSLGLGRDDRICLSFGNGIEAVVAFLATAAAATAAPLNPNYKQEEVRFYMADTRARALILPAGGGETARRAAPPGTILIDARLDDSGDIRFTSEAPASGRRTLTAPRPEDTALVLHTSGTTSRPKRVPLEHRNLITSARNIAQDRPRDAPMMTARMVTSSEPTIIGSIPN